MKLSNFKNLILIICFVICGTAYAVPQNDIRSMFKESPTMSQIVGNDSTNLRNAILYNRNSLNSKNNTNVMSGKNSGSISQNAHNISPVQTNGYSKSTNTAYSNLNGIYRYYGTGTNYYPSRSMYYYPYPITTRTTSVKYGNGSSATYSEDYIYPSNGYVIRRY